MQPVQLSSTLKAFVQALPRSAPVSKGSLFLEVGTGSGRVTRPLGSLLSSAGALLIGADLSLDKLGRLIARDCSSAAHLVQADAHWLPFSGAVFDAVITVRLLHLIADLETILQEFSRLLKPGGVYLRLDKVIDEASIRLLVRRRWLGMLENLGLQQRHGGRSSAQVATVLEAMGVRGQSILLTQTQHQTTAGREVERLALRVKGGTWKVPDQLLPSLLAEMRAWAETEFGSLERECSYSHRTSLQVWRF